jgi:catechol 2,3-dioxygenase-like lactoylglutathione lyase family enzyme
MSFGVRDQDRAVHFYGAARGVVGAWTSDEGAGCCDHSGSDTLPAFARPPGARLPGPGPHFGPDYDAAIVIDPDGHKLEAVHQ